MNDGFKIMRAIEQMCADDNKGLEMSKTLVQVSYEARGAVVGFGTSVKNGKDAEMQITGIEGNYMCVAFFINRKELEKYYKEL